MRFTYIEPGKKLAKPVRGGNDFVRRFVRGDGGYKGIHYKLESSKDTLSLTRAEVGNPLDKRVLTVEFRMTDMMILKVSQEHGKASRTIRTYEGRGDSVKARNAIVEDGESKSLPHDTTAKEVAKQWKQFYLPVLAVLRDIPDFEKDNRPNIKRKITALLGEIANIGKAQENLKLESVSRRASSLRC